MYSSITNKMQRYTMVFITINALHVLGGSSANHQELKTVYTASGICRALLLLTAVVSELALRSCSLTVAVRSSKARHCLYFLRRDS
jgi:multisubunit Na+/H+ antiporter MnhC subunit